MILQGINGGLSGQRPLGSLPCGGVYMTRMGGRMTALPDHMTVRPDIKDNDNDGPAG
jgi:hypothetical protein